MPPDYDAFFARALAKKPEERFQTPTEFSAAVAALPTGGTDARRRGRRAGGPGGERAGRHRRRRSRARPCLDMAGAGGSGGSGAGGAVRMPIMAVEVVVGRSDPQRGFHPDVDLLPLDHQQTVSRRHARIVTRHVDAYFIEDLNAFNRTRVNGLPLVPHQEHELHDGDALRLGNVELRFELGPR